MFNKLKQFKDLRSQAKQLQNTLKDEKVEIEKSGVKVIMDGNQEVVSISIDPEIINKENKEELEKRTKEAFNTAIEKTKKVMAKKMQSMGGLDAFGMGK